jgi:hypothetical protein
MNRYLVFLLCACGLLVPARADAQLTALHIDSQVGDPVGNGQDKTWFGVVDLNFTATSGSARRVSISANNFSSGPPFTSWNLIFAIPQGMPVAPGVYESAERFAGPLRPELDVTGNGSGCNTVTGRFVVYEIEIAGSAVTRFAADFEQHCDDIAPALFGAIRFNSSRPSLTPFDGAYPDVRLHIDPSPYGRVTAAGIDCGNGGADCDEVYDAPTTAALTVTPAPGYAFLGWTGNCEGKLVAASLLVAQRRRCAPVFDAVPGSGVTPPLTGGTGFFADMQARPFRPEQKWVLLPSDTLFTLFQDDPHRVDFRLEAPDGEWWDVAFAAPEGQILAPGVYDNARRYPFQSPKVPGFSLSGHGNSCNQLQGRFVIYEVTFDGSGNLLRFAADFEQHCEMEIPATSGAIRFNATTRAALIPFDGVYPLYRVTIVPPLNGSVTAAGIQCGADCSETYASGGTMAITATAAPGFVFVGWTGDCSGSWSGKLLVITTHVCGAVFDNAPGNGGALPGELGLGSLSLFSQRGDYIGQGETHVWTRTESLIQIDVQAGPLSTRHVAFRVIAPDGNRWGLNFAAPVGQVLQPGDYVGATRWPFQASSVPGLDVSGFSRGCNALTGRFRIYQIHFDSGGNVDQFAADFEQHCEGGAAALFGAFRFNSTRSSLLPFGDVPFRPIITINPPSNGGVVMIPFTIGGWAIHTGDRTTTGINAVHLYAYPAAGGAPYFLGIAAYGIPRPDVGAIFGAPYTNSGFSLTVSGGLPQGTYILAAIARNAVTGVFDSVGTTTVTVFAQAVMAVGLPADKGTVSGPFLIAGWAIDSAAPSGSGVDAIHAWAWPAAGGGPIFLGATTTDAMRPDVAAIFGARFLVSGFNLDAPALPPGTYVLAVYAHSAATGTFNQVRTLTVVVN